MRFINMLKKSLFIFFLFLGFGLTTPARIQATDDRRLPDFNVVENAREVGLSLINNKKRNVVNYAVEHAIAPDHSFSHHAESYFYTDDPQILAQIVEEVIKGISSSKDNVSHRGTFEIHKIFSRNEARQLVGRDFIGHDAREGKDTNRVIVVIAVEDLQKVRSQSMISKGIHWLGGAINTALPEDK